MKILKRTRIIIPIIAVCLVFVSVFCYYNSVSRNASAGGGNAYNPTTPGHSGCSSICYQASHFGVAWIFYPFEAQYGYDAASQTVNAPNTVEGPLSVANCIANGANGYYRLGRVWYIASTLQPTTVGGVYQYGYYSTAGVGLLGAGGSAIYYSNYSSIGGEAWGDVETKFNDADPSWVNGKTWNDVSMFCYNNTPPPPVIVTPPPASGIGWTSTTEVIVPNRDGGVDEVKIESEEDMQAVIALSADNDFKVRFRHIMHFTPSPGPWQEGCQGKQVEDSCTGYTVTTDGGPTKTGTICADSVSGAIRGDPVIYDEEVTVSPGNDTRNWAFSVNDYDTKSYTYPSTAHRHCHSCCDSDGDCIRHDTRLYTYSAVGSGSGQSAGAVSAIKPKDPSGPVVVHGATGGDFIFAGERVDTTWNTTATGRYERRIMATQSPIYQVDNAVSYSSEISQITKREYTSDPCGHWQGFHSGICTSVADNRTFGDGAYNSPVTSSPTLDTYQVPDDVGDKFCATYGYNWQYYWGNGNNFGIGEKPIESQLPNWATESGAHARYWFVFGSSCRVIAKKPTTALWNGGLLTNGGVNTSVAPRHIPGTFAAHTGSTTSFGSWTEYLGVIGGKVSGFGTGGSYARGTRSSTDLLTIANRGTLGYSGVSTSSAYRTRLDTYLRTAATNSVTDMYSPPSNNGTKITVLPGGSEITSNIENNGNYGSIYQLPQNIIFVDGDLKIRNTVTRIDAWLIVTGNLDTCPSFVSGDTDTAPGSGDCDSQLVFNGPVLSGSLSLKRTYGADSIEFPARYSPAEVFNLSADSYLWAYAQAGRYGSSYTESYSRELAPRY